VNEYFEKRFPLKKPGVIPEISSKVTFRDLFNSSANFGYMSKYQEEYVVNLAGCAMPNQRWFRTMFCIDILKFYADLGDPCASGPPPSICQSTLRERATSLRDDASNSMYCPIMPKSARDRAANYIKEVENHPWMSTSQSDASCISGGANEESNPLEVKCGYSEVAACEVKTRCPTLSPYIESLCPTLMKDAKSAVVSKSEYDPNDRNPSNSSRIVMGILGGGACLALVFGFAAMYRVQRSSGSKNATTPSALRQADPYLGNNAAQAKRNRHGSNIPSQVFATPVHPSPHAHMSVVPAPSVASIAQSSLAKRSHNVEMYYVVTAFRATQVDEITLNVGAGIQVLEKFDDGWAHGMDIATGQSGFFPLSCVQPSQ
jgi:hypothetical protein